jgi:hypothetical protein
MNKEVRQEEEALQGDEEDSRYMIDTIVPMVLRISLEREARIESLHTTIPPVNT